MVYKPLFVDSQNRQLKGKNLPMISQDLDSVRTYQWEITFYGVPVDGVASLDRPLTLAAKQVSQTGFQLDDIEVHRVNDKVFYPGKGAPDELRVTFDNLLKHKMGTMLYKWIQTIYNPVTGEFTPGRSVGAGNVAGNFKIVADLVQLDNKGQPIAYSRFYGLFPKSWRQAEFNYSSNDFHSIEVAFRYDFIVQNGNANT